MRSSPALPPSPPPPPPDEHTSHPSFLALSAPLKEGFLLWTRFYPIYSPSSLLPSPWASLELQFTVKLLNFVCPGQAKYWHIRNPSGLLTWPSGWYSHIALEIQNPLPRSPATVRYLKVRGSSWLERLTSLPKFQSLKSPFPWIILQTGVIHSVPIICCVLC